MTADNLHERLRAELRLLAADRAVVSYADLAVRAAVPPPHTIHRLTEALEDLVREDAAAGRPLLAALAVSRGASALPGPGFFQLARELGLYDGPDRGPGAATWHATECTRAWDHWGGRAGD